MAGDRPGLVRIGSINPERVIFPSVFGKTWALLSEGLPPEGRKRLRLHAVRRTYTSRLCGATELDIGQDKLTDTLDIMMVKNAPNCPVVGPVFGPEDVCWLERRGAAIHA